MNAPMNCELKTRLLTEYQSAAAVYSKAISEFSRMIGKTNGIEYEKLHRSLARARMFAGEARHNIDSHTLEHGC